MSANDGTIDLGGINIKEWSLIILLFSIAFVFVSVGVTLILVVQAGGLNAVTVTGEINIGDYNVIIVGIAMVAVSLVAQQLATKLQTAAIARNDAVWLRELELELAKKKKDEEEKSEKKSTEN